MVIEFLEFLAGLVLVSYKIENVYMAIAVKCLRALFGLFSPNLIDQSSCRMGLALTCVVRLLDDDWSIRLGENKLCMVLRHLGAMLCM